MTVRLVLLCAAMASAVASEQAPVIVVAPEDQKVAQSGIANFYCQATGSPTPSVEWRKSGQRIGRHHKRYLIVDASDGSVVLRIEPVRARRDEDSYECRADNGVGTPAVARARLNVYPDEQSVPAGYPDITENPTWETVQKDSEVTLTCSATGDPVPTISWLKNFMPLDIADPRISVLPSGSLQILGAEQSDEGKYECVAQNSAGIAYSYPANLAVHVIRRAPHFSFPPENVEVMPGGSANLTCVAVGSPMPYVRWRLGSAELTQPESIGRSVLVLTNIQESATYTCVAANEMGRIENTTNVTVKALPRAPINLEAVRVGSTSAQLRWEPGSDDPVDSYTIRWQRRQLPREPHSEIGDIVNTEHTVTDLVPYSTYEVDVVAVNNIGPSLPASVVITTNEDVPGSPPVNVRARPVSASTVVVQWEEPLEPHGVVKGYSVYYTLNADQLMSTWSVLRVDNGQLTTIGSLLTNETYTIAVAAFTDIGEGPPSEPMHVRTQLGVPEQPRDLRGEAVSATAIQLEWTAPHTVGSDPVTSYELYYNDSTRRQNVHLTISAPVDSYLLEDLSANSVYNIRVSAATSHGEGPTTAAISVRTREAAPGAAPLSVSGETVNSHSIRVTWAPPPTDQWNGVLAGYRVLYAESDGGSSDGNVASVPADDMSYTVRGLRAWTSYNVWVLAYTVAGDGPRSDVIVVQTAEDVPGEPRRVRLEAVNSTAVHVQWRPPLEREQNGVIRGYQVLYMRIDEREEGVGGTRVYDVMGGNVLEVVIGNLEPEAQYQFQVAAYTRKGDGERSRPKKIRTKGAVLGAPRNLQLTLTQEDPPMFQASWQAPRSPISPVLGYRIQYGIRGSDNVETREVDADRYRITTTFLDRGVEYECHVSAKNAIDFGTPAVATIHTPEGVPAGAPLNVSSANVTSSSLRLQWDPPARHHRNGVIVLYEVLYRLEDNYIDDWTTNTSVSWIVVEGLEPEQNYVFQIRAYTGQGGGPWSDPHLVQMLSQNVILAPSNVRIKRLSQTEMEITWNAPSPIGTAQITGYVVHYTSHVTPDEIDRWPSVNTGPVTSVRIGQLEPHTVYAAAVRARSADNRLGTFSDVAVDNHIDSPEAEVKDFHDAMQQTRSVVLEWLPPRRTDVARYKIDYRGVKHYRDAAGVVLPLTGAKGEVLVSKGEQSVVVDNLVPKTPYIFHIRARFADGTWGPRATTQSETLADAPPDMQQPLFNRLNGDSTVTMRVFPASDKHGPITDYYVIVVTDEVAQRKQPDDFTLAEVEQDAGADQPAWIAAQYSTSPLPREVNLGDGSYLGNGKYYNRPLMKHHLYRMFVRSYVSDNKFTSSPYSDPFSVDLPSSSADVVSVAPAPDGMDLVWIVAPVCVAVILILLIVLIIVYVRKKLSKKDRPLSPTKVLLPPGELLSYAHDPVELRRLNFQTPGMASHPPIPITQLPEYVAALRANDGEGFSREYESIEPGQPFTWDASTADANKAKNRYANVVAYDHSRVVLEPIDGAEGSDYINANYMDGYCRLKAYVATQGPLVETFNDFWRMIWEQQVTTIVMMTKLEERNRVKCDQYWPNRGTEIYGLVQVTITDVLELATFTVRTFHISLGNYLDKREVRQFQFTAWPDHGVPEHPLPLLQFIHRVKSMTPPDNVPTVVHCSAGVGRTGTYVVIDSMLDRIQHEQTLDVYGHVTCLRAQRNYMVQTEDQYVFIYEALLDAVESGNTEVPADSLYLHVQHLTTLYVADDPRQPAITGMEIEFKKLANVKVDPTKFGSANFPVNKGKNRLVNILPFESSRVTLQQIRGVEGSDYINASYIDGYRCRKAYIATQGPMVETTEDFWRMLWEHNSSIVVMMTKVKEMGVDKCHQYWPEERSARYQYFVVDPLAHYNMPLYVLREFKVTDARDGQSRTIRQFQFTDWPEQGVPSSGEGFIEFIGHVQKTKEKFGQDGPVTVHCSMGVGRTGVFIALSIALERMRFEGVVDMFQTVRLLRTQRPAMVQTEDQYAFCYRAALEYLSSFDHYAS